MQSIASRIAAVAFVLSLIVQPWVRCHPDAGYAAKLEAQRKKNDEEFRDSRKSPLCSVAVARLDRARTTIGSSPEADLLLRGDTVAPIHAEILRQEGPDGKALTWILRPVGGEVRDEMTGEVIQSAELAQDHRFSVGKYTVLRRQLGTFGPVVRALDSHSPALAAFKGRNYFAPDPSFRVTAEIVPDASLTPVMIQDTQGWKRPGWKYGEARFEMAGQKLALTLWLFTPAPREREDLFFMPFKDRTSGRETYGGGRFLDVSFTPSGQVVIDFNEAYNPSCAYSAGFACPMPPRGNVLPIEIRAGEKIYSKDHH